jgi:hypothetical protein
MLRRRYISHQNNVSVYDYRGPVRFFLCFNCLTICSVLKVLISWLESHNPQTKDISLLERMRTFTRSVQQSSPAPTIDGYAKTLTNLIDTQVSF